MIPLINKRTSSGFTYLALLFLIAAMGAILGATIEIWHTSLQREKERELLFVGDQFRKAIGAYTLDHAKTYPHNLEDLLKDPQQVSIRRYLRKIYQDPITGKFEWGLLRSTDGGIVGVFSQSEARPIKNAGFDEANSSFEGASKYSDWVFAFRPRQKQPSQASATPSNDVKGIVGQ